MMIQTTRRARATTTDFTTTTTRRARGDRSRRDHGRRGRRFVRVRARVRVRVVESRRHRLDESRFRGKTRLTSHDPSMSPPPHAPRHPRRRVSPVDAEDVDARRFSTRRRRARVSTVSTDRRARVRSSSTNAWDRRTDRDGPNGEIRRERRGRARRRARRTESGVGG
jgi:hypothetical protein